MGKSTNAIRSVPTNIITGFLGVGKTTAILHLLKTKPAQQRWAVLINEFGEIGVDGGLLRGQYSEDNGVYVREVPGGCMCCTAGLPMQVGLNSLLTRSRPDRLLIEPTGLGHPQEVLQVLSDMYREVLSVQQVLTLVDARHLLDQRYTDNETFNQQIAIANIVIGNKSELYLPDDAERLQTYVQRNGRPSASVMFASNGQLDPSILDRKADLSVFASGQTESHHHHHEAHIPPVLEADKPLPANGYLKAENKGEGYCSVGWRFKADKIFHHDRLFSFLSGIEAMRMKAFFLTDKGMYGYNMASGSLTEIALQDCAESHIEIIDSTIDDDWENQLLQCLAE
ncbi:CobW family GTP-binding protein [Granulosicoccus antarcticus]|uniref:Zinc-binding GTPase YeiR n=1 Tax=Granulosicoccus antarcticus IMCC3135 TaxID=1192854 RepID=A0A2Z2NP86_9GAMM|nr:GTP-binding protein [Granulosicoccus antarcticus]ASJ73246.1 Zinc-binding GTPase YeiR [Granulosicoccus antarcticus IMCC3135]